MHVARTRPDPVLGPSGWRGLLGLPRPQLERLAREPAELAGDYETTILALPSGIGALPLRLAVQAERVLRVATPEPTARTDTYALLEANLRAHADVVLVITMAAERAAGMEAAGARHHLPALSVPRP